MINHLCYSDTQELWAKNINKQNTAQAQAAVSRDWRQSVAKVKSEPQATGRLKRDHQYKSAWEAAVISSKLILAE